MDNTEQQELIQKISTNLQRLSGLLDQLEALLKTNQGNSIGEWIAEDKLIAITGLSSSTLYEMRRNGELLSSKLTPRTTMYNTKSLIKLLERNSKK